jgi:phosphopantetheine--protein transferase-like protein
VSRIEKLLTKSKYFHDRFLTGAFHPIEVEEYHSKKVDKVKYQYIASRWALKEALVKASGRPDLKYPNIYLKKDINIDPETGEEKKLRTRPRLVVDGDHNLEVLYNSLKVSSIHSSISHEELFAIAFVTLETEE